MVPDSVVLVVLVLASTGLASHGDSVLAAVLGGGAKQVPGLGCLACRYTGRLIKDDTNISLCLIGCRYAGVISRLQSFFQSFEMKILLIKPPN